jgi:DNA-binding NtrC family response regulator
MDEEKRLFLHVEDDIIDSGFIEDYLRDAGFDFRFRRVETRSQFLAALEGSQPDLILCDYNLPLFSGLEALALSRDKSPEVPFIFISGTMGESLAVDTLKKGATDYILKGDLARLVPAVRRALEDSDVRRTRARAKHEVVHHEKLAMIGQLSAGIAHEINNPLTYVNLNLESMVEYADVLNETLTRCRAI